ncbi:hypothetical protein VNO77_02343 [Canavalia gladiata]|uniref:Uncharacterized protein n=1 Tax=Canavalia gladiata TaxID=3824 RepID=A0AAN9MUW4_CANGL
MCCSNPHMTKRNPPTSEFWGLRLQIRPGSSPRSVEASIVQSSFMAIVHVINLRNRHFKFKHGKMNNGHEKIASSKTLRAGSSSSRSSELLPFPSCFWPFPRMQSVSNQPP